MKRVQLSRMDQCAVVSNLAPVSRHSPDQPGVQLCATGLRLGWGAWRSRQRALPLAVSKEVCRCRIIGQFAKERDHELTPRNCAQDTKDAKAKVEASLQVDRLMRFGVCC